MRSRNIKPGFYKNEDLAECSLEARFIFPGLWMLADRMGRLEYRPKRIKGELFPFDNIEITPLLDELSKWSLIKFYEIEGCKYIWIPAFLKHQNPHRREAKSVLPPHPEDTNCDLDSDQGQDEPQPRTVQGQSKDVPCTNQGQDEPQPRTCSARLIPESGILNPDSLIPEVNTSCPTPQKSEAPDQQPEVEKENPFLTIPLVTKNKATGESDEFPIYPAQLSEWAECFPALDIPQVIREIKAWNLANPANRKTKTGILKHINGWLSKEQNKAKPHVRGQPAQARVIPMTREDRNKLACEEAIRRYGNEQD